MEALAGIRIPGEARQCLDVIFRKTYGWKKKEDNIALCQFQKYTGLKKQTIIKARNKLLALNLITVTQKDNRSGQKYRFNKDYDTWKPLSKKITVTQKDNSPLPKKIHTNTTTTNTILSPAGDPTMKLDERSFSDSNELQIDSETGDEIRATLKAKNSMLKLLRWAEKRKGMPFANAGKQFKAMKMAKTAGYDSRDLALKWLEMEEDKYWRNKGFDFMNIINELDKKYERT